MGSDFDIFVERSDPTLGPFLLKPEHKQQLATACTAHYDDRVLHPRFVHSEAGERHVLYSVRVPTRFSELHADKGNGLAPNGLGAGRV